MVETSENQKEMNKVLQDLLKSGFVKQAVVENGEEEEKKKRKKDKDKDKEREKEKERERKESPEREPVMTPQPQHTVPPPQIDHEFEEMKWANNLALIGDG